jgi:hypothetical protein
LEGEKLGHFDEEKKEKKQQRGKAEQEKWEEV